MWDLRDSSQGGNPQLKLDGRLHTLGPVYTVANQGNAFSSTMLNGHPESGKGRDENGNRIHSTLRETIRALTTISMIQSASLAKLVSRRGTSGQLLDGVSLMCRI